MTKKNARLNKRPGWLFSCMVLATLTAAAAGAQPPEAIAVMDGMVDANIIKQVDYSFYAVAYDEADDVLYFAARDGGHFDPTMDVVYRVPIASINVVDVTSNSDVIEVDGQNLSRGCTVHLVAKDPDFGWGKLVEGQVSDGNFTVDYAELELDATKTVDVGFFECDHARAMQVEFHKLHKQVKKGM